MTRSSLRSVLIQECALYSWSDARALASVLSSMSRSKKRRDLSLKIQGAFFYRVSVAHHQNRDEAEHAPENDAALPDCVAVHDGPRVHEHDLDVEQDKKHRHDIKFYAEARLAFTLGDHPAFIRSILGGRTFSAFAHQHTDNQRGSGEKDGYKNLQENRQIFA